jgi:hypothetical protein
VSTDRLPSPLGVIRRLLPDAEIIHEPTPDAALYGGAYSEPPALRDAPIIDGSVAMRAVRISCEPEVAFDAFLDGAQQVRILSHWHGVPILLGTVSAVIRVRQNRRLVTWGHRPPVVRQRLYLPLRYLTTLASLTDGDTYDGYDIVDTALPDVRGEFPSRHPGALRACALDRIRADRERLELELAESWCVRDEGRLCIDGPIGSRERVAHAACAVGLVKSHNTLHATGVALDVVMRLQKGERSSVFRVGNRGGARTPVASWYLRVRDPRGRDAMFGLVRVEVTAQNDTHALTEHADLVSSWILAESAPLSLPDARWDTMMYGVRDCEQFLRAIAS